MYDLETIKKINEEPKKHLELEEQEETQSLDLETYKINMYFGLKDKSNKTIDYYAALSFLEQLLLDIGIEGYTIIEATGYYKGIEEETIILSVLYTKEYEEKFKSLEVFMNNLKLISLKYKQEFKQESVLFEYQKVFYNFI